MKYSLLLAILLFSSTSFSGEVVPYDFNKKLVKHISKSKSTIIYIGEDWCHFCRQAKKVLKKAASDYDTLHIVFLETDKIPVNANIEVGDEDLRRILNELRGIPKFVTFDIKTGTRTVGHADPINLIKRLIGEKLQRTKVVPN